MSVYHGWLVGLAAFAIGAGCSGDRNEADGESTSREPRGNPMAAVEAAATRRATPPPSRAAELVGATVAPLQSIAGMRGVWIAADVTFAAAPDQPHRTVTTFVFPDRARFELSHATSVRAGRRTEYRLGDRLFVLDRAADEPTALEGSSRTSLHQLLELRRALYLWPDGFEWADVDDAPGVREVALADGSSGGRLRASLGEDGRPRTVAIRGADDGVVAQLDVVGWKRSAGRDHPSEVVFSSAGQTVWTERTERFVPDATFVDSYFLPPSLRGDSVPARRAQEVTTGPLTAAIVLAVPLDSAGGDWDRARTAAAAAAELRRGAGLELAPGLKIEVDASGRPGRALLTLAEGSGAPPPGWTAQPSTVAARLFVDGTDALGADAVAAVRAALPLGPTAPPAYVFLAPGEARALLVQPLE